MDLLFEMAWRSIFVFLWFGSGCAVILSVLMLFAPDMVRRLNDFFNFWIDTHGVGVVLDRPRWSERFVYRHHRLTGSGLFFASLFVVYRFLLRPPQNLLTSLAIYDTYGLMDAALALFVIGGVLGAVIGLVIFLKPSVLRELETAANRWVSTERISRAFDRMHPSVDRFVLNSRAMAGVLLLGSVYVFVVLGWLLLADNWRL